MGNLRKGDADDISATVWDSGLMPSVLLSLIS